MQSRSTLTGICAAALALLVAAPIHAQILPRIPPPPLPKKEYVPPPAPKPVEVKPPEPEAEVPTLVIRDASGTLKTYDTSLEEAAIRATKFPPAQQAKVDASIAARQRDLEQWTVDNLEKVKTAVTSRHDLDDLKDFNQLFRAKEAANALQQESILDRLVRDNAITILLKTRVERVVNEYNDLRKTSWEGQTGADVMKIAMLVGRQSFDDQARDVLAALDRLISRASPTLASQVEALGLNAEQREKLAALPKAEAAGTPDSPRRHFVLDVLTPEQRKTLLEKFVPPPAPRK